jgi:hypothetical protein
LLEREGTLKVLAAVQAAAEDEMAFKQRAAVAENFQDFVLCHGMNVKSKVQSSKSKVGGVGVLRQAGVHASACQQNKLKLELQLRFLLASGFRILNSGGVPKWIKFILAILLLPVGGGAAMALWRVLCASGGADVVWVPLLAGAACWIVIFLLLPKPMWIYVFGHELTHALWAWLFGGQVKKMKVSSAGGQVVVSKSNFLIVLAPYFFPLYTALGLVELSGLVSSAGRGDVCVSCDADRARSQDAAIGHHVAGLVVFGGDPFPRQRWRAAVWAALFDRKSQLAQCPGLVAGGHGTNLPLAGAAGVSLATENMSIILS